jgi:hypothetical protein
VAGYFDLVGRRLSQRKFLVDIFHNYLPFSPIA